MAIPKGTVVRQVVPVVTGTVAGYAVDGESGKVQVLVEWTCDEGHVHSRYFTEDEVEVVV